MRVIIVGGGIAGLSCAWELTKQGHEVCVLERETTPGGRMRSERHDGFIVDRGAQFIASAYTNLHALAGEVGLTGDVRTMQRPRNAVLRAGRLYPADHGSPFALLTSPLVSARTRIRLPRLLFELWRRRAYIDPRRPERAAPIDTEDLPSFVRRTLGDEALEYLLGPEFSATFDSDPEDFSAVFALLATRMVLPHFRLQSFAGGTGRLTQTLAERLIVRTDAAVEGVEVHLDGVTVRYRDACGNQSAEGDAAVIAVPGPLVDPICATLTDAERSFFRSVRYGRGIIVFFLLDAPPATLPYYGVAFPRREGLDLYGLAVDHHKPGVTPSGGGLFNVSLTAAASARLWDASDDAVATVALDNLARTPIGRLAPRAAVVHRWDPMLPQFYAGYTRRIDEFLRRTPRTPRLAFAGDYLVGPFTEAALTSGLRAAEELAASVTEQGTAGR